MSETVADPRTLICHDLPPAERLPALLRAFDALIPGGSFELHSAHAQNAALLCLTKERAGLFEWSPLQQGPELWRTTVTRRTGGSTLRELTEALASDHERLDDLERRAFEARAAGDTARAARLFADFARGLRRHIAFEEGVLFPAFEARSPFPPREGPTEVMRLEHRQIEALLDRASNAEGRAPLLALLDAHNTKEEAVLYPFTDRLLTPEERDHLVGRIQAFVS
ncbi:MAG TPA: hemerythrin domain-containing protein [Candidatus Polarisedimenticolaceae bacterium]|nr:hemerythrin domain-containing protein [Candidatus Polarisedimenticolaceae bacterium]